MTGHRFIISEDNIKSEFVRLVKDNNFEKKLREYMALHNLTSIVVQGELCSPKIRRNKLKLNEPHWYIFTADENRQRVDLKELQQVVEFIGGEMVMLEEEDEDLPSKYPTIEALLERADGKYPSGTIKEGIVIRPCTPIFKRNNKQSYLSMKIINNRYLLKND